MKSLTVHRESVCGMCGLAICLCFLTAEVVELAHPHVSGRPSIVATAPGRSPHHDHAHEECVGFVSMGESRFVASTGGGVVLPQGQENFASGGDYSAQRARSYDSMGSPAKPSAATRSWPRWSSTRYSIRFRS